MDLIDKFGGVDRSENEARRTSALTKGLAGADYLSFDHISHAVSNFVCNSVKNVSNYLIIDAKRAFNQLRQAFTKESILQHFDLEQYIQVKTDASGHAFDRVLS